MMADLVRWNPFDELQEFTDTFDRLVNRWRSGSAWNEAPTRASIRSVDDGYLVRIPLPGIAPENVTVEIADGMMQVRGVERDGETQVRRYEEVMTLPASVDADQARATFRHGLLELMLPYQEAVKPRRIAIETQGSKQLPRAA